MEGMFGCIATVFIIWIACMLVVASWHFAFEYTDIVIEWGIPIIGVLIVFVVFMILREKHYKQLESFKKQKDDFEKYIREEKYKINKRETLIHYLLQTDNVFRSTASMYTDVRSCLYEEYESYFIEKSRPAYSAAEQVRELKKKYKEEVTKLKETIYKFDYIISIFPELKDYIEDNDAILSLDKQTTIRGLKDNRDHSKDYLSDEEWDKLNDIDKWQLALDRYKERRRGSSWTAGVEYELYCAWILRKHGYTVIEHGAERKLNDLGRDLIATDGTQTYIIQCKRYSELKGVEIHENTICQLFGTTLHYNITHDSNIPPQAIPVLIYTGKVSEVAQEFANKLGVVLHKMPMGDYPMIKCNKNNRQKIFHLPFDQQYWNTKIDFSSGEFYAFTVKEALDAGFRRALRWSGNPNQG